MGNKAGLRQEHRKKQSRVRAEVATIGAVVTGLLLFVLPRTGAWVATDLCFAWMLLLYCVWHCWGLYPTWIKRIGFLLLHTAVVISIGNTVWPRIRVSPSVVRFEGFPNETFDFSVRNERSDDIYEVHVPFLIGYGKHFDSKFSVKIQANSEPPQPNRNDFSYCFGRKGDGDVKKVMPNEREVLVVNIRHLAPNGSGTFSVTYAGGEKLEVHSFSPIFRSEPYSYSPMQGTVDIQGDYRICRIDMHSDASESK